MLVGAVKNYREGIDYQLDDEGENISDKNPYYNELTAMYWAWKNLNDVDAIGLVHYRRYFGLGKKRDLDDVLSSFEIEDLLKKVSVIVPKRRKYYIESNYSHYIHAHHREPLDDTIAIISKYFPEYKDSLDNVLTASSAHMFNMLIMNKEVFDSYCSWLFNVLGRLEKDLDLTEYSTQEKRVYGFVSELLLDVWLNKNRIKYVECRWFQVGERHLMKKAYYFILRKFGLNTRSSHF